MEWIRVWRWARGWVRFEAEGGAPGRLLTLAAREGLPIWDTHREGVVLTAHCFAADYRKLRPLARRSGLRLHLKERHGAAFVMRRYHARPGLLAGVVVYAVLLVFLSGRIWSLDIRGLDSADEAALRGLLAEHGVAVGRAKAGVDSEAVRLDALTRLTDISWLAVNLDGCVAEVEVREMNPDETPPESTAPSNLVAARDGIILSVEVTGGAATVQVGDAVAEGGMLASGILVTERETLFRRSSGRVMAETEREITVRVPLTESLLLPAGDATETLELHLFGLLLPLFDNSVSGTDCRLEEHDSLLTINEVPLPLGVRMRRYTPLAEQQVTRTAEEAEALARERLGKEEEAELKDVEVLEREITVEERDGVLILKATYRCVENIAREIPIQMETAP